MKFRATLLFFAVITSARAVVVSPTSQELDFSYEAEFVTPHPDAWDFDDDGNLVWESDPAEPTHDGNRKTAEFHAQHLFGILQSQEYAAPFFSKKERELGLVVGLGTPNASFEISHVKTKLVDEAESFYKVSYSARGKFLLHNNVVKAWEGRTIELPLVYDLPEIYSKQGYRTVSKHCTDQHYGEAIDFWYFYNPWFKGCEKFQRGPLVRTVKVHIGHIKPVTREYQTKLNMIRGDNGNGDKVSIYVVHGYAENAKSRKDEGSELFHELDKDLIKRGFEFNRDKSWTTTNAEKHVRFSRFEKTVRTSDSDHASPPSITYEVNHLLDDTDPHSLEFVKFWKHAIEHGDIIVYGGHSGSGGNLDLNSINSTLAAMKPLQRTFKGLGRISTRPINFPENKRQIMFVDSCSSFAYYYRPYLAESSRKSIDIVSYGLQSFFEDSGAVHGVFWDAVFDPTSSPAWIDLLTAMEKPLHGWTYLINVGGL